LYSSFEVAQCFEKGSSSSLIGGLIGQVYKLPNVNIKKNSQSQVWTTIEVLNFSNCKNSSN